MEFLNFGLSEFLGIFLVGFPAFIFLTTIFQRGILGIFKHLEPLPHLDPIFHHHFHYKATGKRE